MVCDNFCNHLIINISKNILCKQNIPHIIERIFPTLFDNLVLQYLV